MNPAAERAIRGAMRFAESLGGSAAVGLTELLSLALSLEEEDRARLAADAERKRTARKRPGMSADAPSSSLSLLDQDQEREEGERERESGVRLVADRCGPGYRDGPKSSATYGPEADTGAGPCRMPPAPRTDGSIALDSAPTPAQDAATAKVGLADPSGAWLAFLANRRAKKRDPHDLGAWVIWATRAKRYELQDAARAPPAVDPRQQAFDWREKARREDQELAQLAKAAVGPPPEALRLAGRGG